MQVLRIHIDEKDVIDWLNKVPEPELAKTPVQLLATMYLIEKISGRSRPSLTGLPARLRIRWFRS